MTAPLFEDNVKNTASVVSRHGAQGRRAHYMGGCTEYTVASQPALKQRLGPERFQVTSLKLTDVREYRLIEPRIGEVM